LSSRPPNAQQRGRKRMSRLGQKKALGGPALLTTYPFRPLIGGCRGLDPHTGDVLDQRLAVGD